MKYIELSEWIWKINRQASSEPRSGIDSLHFDPTSKIDITIDYDDDLHDLSEIDIIHIKNRINQKVVLSKGIEQKYLNSNKPLKDLNIELSNELLLKIKDFISTAKSAEPKPKTSLLSIAKRNKPIYIVYFKIYNNRPITKKSYIEIAKNIVNEYIEEKEILHKRFVESQDKINNKNISDSEETTSDINFTEWTVELGIYSSLKQIEPDSKTPFGIKLSIDVNHEFTNEDIEKIKLLVSNKLHKSKEITLTTSHFASNDIHENLVKYIDRDQYFNLKDFIFKKTDLLTNNNINSSNVYKLCLKLFKKNNKMITEEPFRALVKKIIDKYFEEKQLSISSSYNRRKSMLHEKVTSSYDVHRTPRWTQDRDINKQVSYDLIEPIKLYTDIPSLIADLKNHSYYITKYKEIIAYAINKNFESLRRHNPQIASDFMHSKSECCDKDSELSISIMQAFQEARQKEMNIKINNPKP